MPHPLTIKPWSASRSCRRTDKQPVPFLLFIPATLRLVTRSVALPLEGAQTYARYVEDAGQESDRELVQFFTQVQQEENARADKAKQLLARRIQSTGRTR